MSAANEVTVVAQWQTTSIALPEVLGLLAELRPRSLAEPGCLSYEVYRSVETPASVLLVERYRDEAALEQHRQSEHYQTLVMARALPLLTARKVEFLRPRNAG
ncbi:putative quinol monooxygenase [Oxalobacteraceae bacterium A2-2]